MARPLSFDRDAVLDKALDLFWRHGYGGTSVRDLTAALGITAPSLYNTFGDKRQLFAAALERYRERNIAARRHAADAAGTPLGAISIFFTVILEQAAGPDGWRGCLIANSAVEVAPHDPEMADLIRAAIQENETFIAERLEAGQAYGEVRRDRDAHAMAISLLATLHGLRVLARAGRDVGDLSIAADQALANVTVEEIGQRHHNA